MAHINENVGFMLRCQACLMGVKWIPELILITF